MEGEDFVKRLLAEIDEYRGTSTTVLPDTEISDQFSPDIIKHWLNFAVYYERASVIFISGWMKTTLEDDLLLNFAHQIEDECNHYRWLKKHLQSYVGADIHQFVPPPEWKMLMEEFYPNLQHTVERLAAHNLASETGAIGFLEYGFNRFPDDINRTVKRVLKDERYHVSFGCRLLAKYCNTKQLQDKARAATFNAMQLMLKARDVFVPV